MKDFCIMFFAIGGVVLLGILGFVALFIFYLVLGIIAIPILVLMIILNLCGSHINIKFISKDS